MLNDANPSQELKEAQERRLLKAWQTPKGWRYWSEVNNTSVGLWYTIAAFGFFLFAGVLALLIRIQLAIPNNDFLSADTYNQVFTMHGSVMMFLFAVPIFEAISILLMPQMLGARDLPFPRLSSFGFWCYLIGGLFVCGSIFFDAAPKGGWFMYPPLTTDYQTGIGADIWLLGLSFIEIASLAAAVELIVGVLKCRPPGMRINLIPLYAWYILVVGAMILFAFPPLIAGDILLELERLLDWPFFDPERGGNPLLWQHLFWIFGHPEVYIVFLPSIALVAMIVPTFARTRMVGYSWIVLAAVGTGFLSFGLWVHHMFTTGLPGISLSFFSAASEAVAIPTGIQFFCFLATLIAGKVTRSVPILFVSAGLATFIIGGLTGVMVALVPFDFQAHDTYFIVGHLHYVLVGGTIFPIIAGIYYFYPMVTGKLLSDKLGYASFWFLIVGFNVTFFPMHISGLIGMPRRVFTYPAGAGFDILNLVSSIGAGILAIGFAIFLWDFLRPRKRQPYAPRNPWNAGTPEWLAHSPSKPWGVRSVPEVKARYPIWDQPNFVEDVDEGRFYLPDAKEERRETLISSIVDSVPQYCHRLSSPSFLPLTAALFTGGTFVFATFHYWWSAAICAGFSFATIVAWLWTGTATIPEKPDKRIKGEQRAPLYLSGSKSVGWWAMFITMLGDFTAFASLIFAYFFYWTASEEFISQAMSREMITLFIASCCCGLLAWLSTLLARKLNKWETSVLYFVAIAFSAICSLSGATLIVIALRNSGFDPTADVYPAIVWVISLWMGLHLALGGVMQLYCLARKAAKRMTGEYDIDIQNVSLYWHFAALTTAITILTLCGFPSLA
ncbi:cytochrome c oxidase subunit I [Pelagicoccus sp. SDUM812002]|uniref:cytochrome c oxidase subunit I n=1 Tax=Pelagicoccus sp. SDUM812002 TaxID=3041266 RepID=UPI00280CE2EC|nr:cytochrome c oxidase subunit I [Pelagicoccus sp. SDUM812002]